MNSSSAPVVRDPEINEVLANDGSTSVEVSGAWDIRALESRARALCERLDAVARSGMRWDLSRVQRLDHIGALLLWRAWGKKRPVHLTLPPQLEVFFNNLDAPHSGDPFLRTLRGHLRRRRGARRERRRRDRQGMGRGDDDAPARARHPRAGARRATRRGVPPARRPRRRPGSTSVTTRNRRSSSTRPSGPDVARHRKGRRTWRSRSRCPRSANR